MKRRIAGMRGRKNFDSAAVTIAGIELAHRIRKGQSPLVTHKVHDGLICALRGIAHYSGRTEFSGAHWLFLTLYDSIAATQP